MTAKTSIKWSRKSHMTGLRKRQRTIFAASHRVACSMISWSTVVGAATLLLCHVTVRRCARVTSITWRRCMTVQPINLILCLRLEDKSSAVDLLHQASHLEAKHQQRKKAYASLDDDAYIRAEGLTIVDGSLYKRNYVVLTDESECDENHFDDFSANDFSHAFSSMRALSHLAGTLQQFFYFFHRTCACKHFQLQWFSWVTVIDTWVCWNDLLALYFQQKFFVTTFLQQECRVTGLTELMISANRLKTSLPVSIFLIKFWIKPLNHHIEW